MKFKLAVLLVAAAFSKLQAGDPDPRATSSPSTLRGLPAPSSAHPIPDTVYLQEIGRKFPTTEPLVSVAAHRGDVFAGTAKGLLRLRESVLSPVEGVAGPVMRMKSIGDRLWLMTGGGLFVGNGTNWTRAGQEQVSDVIIHRGEVVAAAGKRLWRVAGERLEPLTTVEAPFVADRLVPHQESLYWVGQGRVTTFGNSRFGGLDVYGFPSDQAWDWGSLPSPQLRDAVSLGSRIALATDRGLGELRGMSLRSVRGDQGLPFEDLTTLAPGFTNDLWMGTTSGAIRQVGDAFHYFAGERWLPGNRVSSIAVSGTDVWIATDRGLACIHYEPYTLAKKASFYERHLESWGQKRLGFVHKLEWDDALKEFVREAGDNDGGYTGDYLAAQSYRWAVTHDPEARREATNTFHAIRWLEGMTGIPGFQARSVWVKGEMGHKATGGSGGYPAEWHDTADGRFEWKGDTSSDELCSSFYAFSLFLELAAQGDEVALAKDHLGRIASHLVRNQWRLIDKDGKPTRWGRWDPEYLATDEGAFDRGLQCVEILSFMKTAEFFTGQDVFRDAGRKLVDLGYATHTLRQRSSFPPENILHFEDQLAFWCWWNLIRYETDPERRAWYRRGFERSYETVRVEHQPWFIFLHSALSGVAEEHEHAVAHLREWPLDLRIWSYQNSHRSDLRTPSGYLSVKGGVKAFSPREHEPIRWDAWTMKTDGGTGGRDVVEPSGWLLAYWMGRYHGYIGPTATTDTRLQTTAEGEVPQGGAKSYKGPGRPVGY